MIWIIVALILAALFVLWAACVISSRCSRIEERRQLAQDIEKFLEGIKHGN